MGLRVKMNLALMGTLVTGAAIVAIFAHNHFVSQAESEALRNAELIINSAQAIRNYTSEQINPLLARQGKRSYLPQTVPAHAVKENISHLKKRFPDYSYREASMNPANPQNQAVSWEQSAIKAFQEDRSLQKSSGVIDGAHGKALYLGVPVVATSDSCMGCHGDRNNMPITLKTEFTNFKAHGWRRNQVVGAQFVQIPLAATSAIAWKSTRSFVFWLLLVTVLAGMTLIAVLNLIVVKRIRLMSQKAKAISLGSSKFGDFNTTGTDELATLERSFNRMRRSLTNAIDLLEENTGNYRRL